MGFQAVALAVPSAPFGGSWLTYWNCSLILWGTGITGCALGVFGWLSGADVSSSPLGVIGWLTGADVSSPLGVIGWLTGTDHEVGLLAVDVAASPPAFLAKWKVQSNGCTQKAY